MHDERLLIIAPPTPVTSLAELYAIAFDQAQKAAERYDAFVSRVDESRQPVRDVFKALAAREYERVGELVAACVAACGRRPDLSDLRWTPIDLVPAQEIADLGNSYLAAAYGAWALAVRHRQRAFVFWTYVIALAEDPGVRAVSEDLATEALRNGNLLRRERRLAWRQERNIEAEEITTAGTDNSAPAAVLESLLLRDVAAWSRALSPARRDQLLQSVHPCRPSHSLLPLEEQDGPALDSAEIKRVKRQALRRAEQLLNIYLDDLDNAADRASIELAQKRATQSIMRLAELRKIASASAAR